MKLNSGAWLCDKWIMAVEGEMFGRNVDDFGTCLQSASMNYRCTRLSPGLMVVTLTTPSGRHAGTLVPEFGQRFDIAGNVESGQCLAHAIIHHVTKRDYLALQYRDSFNASVLQPMNPMLLAYDIYGSDVMRWLVQVAQSAIQPTSIPPQQPTAE